jgi:hypothetical protein
MSIPFELMVEEQPDSWCCYHVRWCDGEPDSVMLANIPEAWLDLIPFMAARRLLEQGSNPDRLLIVRLHGADFDLMRAPLGVVAAPPLLNVDRPVTRPTHCLYRDHRHAG